MICGLGIYLQLPTGLSGSLGKNFSFPPRPDKVGKLKTPAGSWGDGA